MVVRIKELVIRYEDDGAMSPLSATEHKEKYRPLSLMVHHHCAPPRIITAPDNIDGTTEEVIDISRSD